MARFRYDPAIIERFPEVVGGVIHATGAHNDPTPPPTAAAFQTEILAVRTRIGATPLSELPTLAAWRKVFRGFGVDPTQYRSAAEALLRRLRPLGCRVIVPGGASEGSRATTPMATSANSVGEPAVHSGVLLPGVRASAKSASTSVAAFEPSRRAGASASTASRQRLALPQAARRRSVEPLEPALDEPGLLVPIRDVNVG